MIPHGFIFFLSLLLIENEQASALVPFHKSRISRLYLVSSPHTQLSEKKSDTRGVAYGSFLGLVSHSPHTIPLNWEVL